LRNVVRTQTTGCIYFGHLRVTSNRLHVESPTVLQALFRQSPGSGVAIFIAALELQNTYMEYLEWADAEKTKGIEMLEKKYEDVLDLNSKEYDEAHQEVDEHQKAHFTCLDHYLDSFYLCNGKIMDTQEPINHTKLLRKWGYKFKHAV
jgi:hypothetical protein